MTATFSELRVTRFDNNGNEADLPD